MAVLSWTPELRHSLERWLQEDLGRGDLSGAAVGDGQGCAVWRAKEPGRFCGGPLAVELFRLLNPAVRVQVLAADGEDVIPGTELLRLHGPAAALLAGERVALNLAMRLSGVATATAHLVEQLAGSGIHLVDTRKTTPGLRILEKYAVRCGGGLNHRMGLDDAVMLKENHLAWAGGVVPALQRVRTQAPWPVAVIVEAETEAEAQAAVGAGADGVLLDEFTPEAVAGLAPKLRHTARQRGKALVLEVSGVRPGQLRAYVSCDVDLISISAPVTRSPWLDLAMRHEGRLVRPAAGRLRTQGR
ncbi:carboxylating nicotinate-nucleotide diphosphorylase [Candidatus Synechococcus spongiarum]|uniref:carboxylating nicotinate-nucleotide diphosphorylase n=1 Tax=Candidatus Synechococcus spongiarum TaxID=431041 RepID=UPI001177AA23|nr:carboxylating nicotinate-nucleotide diphosphorylase [Candidatus Synechococcus spongiarum]